MTPKELRDFNDFRRLGPEGREEWLDNASKEEHAYMERLHQMHKFELGQTTRGELDRIMKLAGLSGMQKQVHEDEEQE